MHALNSGAHHVEPHTWGPTLAEGTAIAQPVRDQEVLAAVRGTNGAATAVEETDLRAATLQLARTGLYVEPTSAQVVAATAQFIDQGHLGPADTVVLILTGSGLKANDAMTQLYQTSTRVDAGPSQAGDR